MAEDLTDQPRATADLVQYQEGSVVSRTVMDGKDGGFKMMLCLVKP